MPQTRPLTAEERAAAISQGLNPDDLHVELPGEDTGGMSKTRAALATATGHAGGYIGGGLGAAGGLAAASWLLGPEVGLPASIAALTLGGAGGGYAGQRLQQAVTPTDLYAQQQQAAQEASQQHPYVSAATDIGVGALAGGGRPSLTPLRLATRGLVAPAVENTVDNPAVRQAIGNVITGNAINAGAQTGLSAATQLYNTGTVDPTELAKSAGEGLIGGALFSNPSRYGRLINPSWHPVEMPQEGLQAARITDVNPDASSYADSEIARMTQEHNDNLARYNAGKAAITGRIEAHEYARREQSIRQLGGLLDPKVVPDAIINRNFKKALFEPVTGSVVDQGAAAIKNEQLKSLDMVQKRQLLYNHELAKIDPDLARQHLADIQDQANYRSVRDQQMAAQSEVEKQPMVNVTTPSEDVAATKARLIAANARQPQSEPSPEPQDQNVVAGNKGETPYTPNLQRINPPSVGSDVNRPEVAPSTSMGAHQELAGPRTAAEELQDRLEANGAKYQKGDEDELPEPPSGSLPEPLKLTPKASDALARMNTDVGAVVGDIPHPEGGKALGYYASQLRKGGRAFIVLGRNMLPETPYHELYHQMMDELRMSPHPAAKRFLQGMQDASPESFPHGVETEAKATEMGKRLASDIEGNKSYMADLWSSLKVKFGIAKAGDYDAVASRLLRKMHPESEFKAGLPQEATATSQAVQYQKAPATDDDILKPSEDVVTKGLGGLTRAAVDSIRRIPGKEGPRLATALDKTFIDAKQLQGKWWSRIDDATKGLTASQKINVDRVLNQEVNTKQSMMHLLGTAAERQAYTAVRGVLTEIAKHHTAIGEPIFRNGKPTNLTEDPHYYPTTEDLKAGDTIRQNTNPAAIAKLKADYIDHYMQFNKGARPQDAETSWREFVSSHQGQAGYNAESSLAYFNAARRQQGTPLPDSLRRTDLRENLFNYVRRMSMDMAHYKNIESDHPVAASLGYREDAWGKHIDNTGVNNLNGNNDVEAVMREVRGAVPTLGHRNELAVENAASALLLGPATEAHKVLAPLAQATLFTSNPVEATAMMLHAVTHIGNAWAHAKENGVAVRKPTDITDFTNSHLTFAERVNAGANLWRKVYTLNGLTEQLSVGLSQASGEYLMPAKVRMANNGDADAIRLVKWCDPSWEPGKSYTPEGVQKLASVFSTLLQGSHDARTMPAWALRDGEVGAFFKLMNWNTAQTNTFFRHVWQPAMEGNIVPLVMSAFGATLGGYVIKSIREKIAGKESQIPSLADVAASSRGVSGNIPAVMYNWLSAVSYGGLGGIVSLAAKAPFDVAYRNTPQGAIFPLDEIVTNYAKQGLNIADALMNDPSADIMQIVARAVPDIIFKNTQLGRVALNQGINSGFVGSSKLGEELKYEKETSDRLGQLKRFKQVEGMPVNPADNTLGNPYLNMEQKQFKHTTDVSEAARELPEIIGHLMDKYGSSPDILMAKIKALKENSYSIFPDIENSPLMLGKYLQFLNNKLGADKTNELLQDWMRRKTVNQVKGSLVPS